MSREGQLLFVCCLVLGCDQLPSGASTTVPAKVAKTDITTTEKERLRDLIGKKVEIRGVLSGDYLRLESGESVGNNFKGSDPLTIEFKSHSLPIMPKTNTIATELVGLRGCEVEIEGWISSPLVQGRARNPFGQAGYSGPIPDHEVYFITAEFCRPVQ